MRSSPRRDGRRNPRSRDRRLRVQQPVLRRPLRPRQPQPRGASRSAPNKSLLVPSPNSPNKRAETCSFLPPTTSSAPRRTAGQGVQNTRLLALMPASALDNPEEEAPIWILSVPPTSLKVFDSLRSHALGQHKTVPVGVITQISLGPEQHVRIAALQRGASAAGQGAGHVHVPPRGSQPAPDGRTRRDAVHCPQGQWSRRAGRSSYAVTVSCRAAQVCADTQTPAGATPARTRDVFTRWALARTVNPGLNGSRFDSRHPTNIGAHRPGARGGYQPKRTEVQGLKSQAGSRLTFHNH